MPENLNAFETEIKELEAKLEAKKREFAATGTETHEKNIFKAVLREHTGHEPVVPAQTPIAQPTAQATTTLSPADEQQMDTFVEHAFTKGIISAVAEVKKTGLPFLIDALHDRLADEYYQKLLEARKLNAD